MGHSRASASRALPCSGPSWTIGTSWLCGEGAVAGLPVLPVPPRPGLLGAAAVGLGRRLAGIRVLSSSRAWLRLGPPSGVGFTTTVRKARATWRPLCRVSADSEGPTVTVLLTRRSTEPPTTVVARTVRITRRFRELPLERPPVGWGLGSRGPGRGTKSSTFLAVVPKLEDSDLEVGGLLSLWSAASCGRPLGLFSLGGGMYFLEKMGPWLWKFLEPTASRGPGSLELSSSRVAKPFTSSRWWLYANSSSWGTFLLAPDTRDTLWKRCLLSSGAGDRCHQVKVALTTRVSVRAGGPPASSMLGPGTLS